MLRVRDRLLVVVPVTILIIFLLIYFNTRSLAKTLIIFLAVPFSAVGAIWFLYLLGYNMSIAVWVGLIALMGVDAETGVFMLLYLDLAYYSRRDQGLMKTKEDLRHAIVDGAVKRLRPKFMTVAVMFMGLVPIMWSTGAGSDVMKRIAAPMVGGIFTSFIMELVVYPAIYEVWRWRFHLKKGRSSIGGSPGLIRKWKVRVLPAIWIQPMMEKKMRKIKLIVLLGVTLGLLAFGWNMPGIAQADLSDQLSCHERKNRFKILCGLSGQAHLFLLLRLRRRIQERPGKVPEEDGGRRDYPGKDALSQILHMFR